MNIGSSGSSGNISSGTGTNNNHNAMNGMFLSTELLSTSGSNLPSFFEMIMQDRITQSYKPAIKHIFQILTDRFPVSTLPVLQYFDELYTILQLIIEGYYLDHYDGLLSESLYGLKRSSIANNNNNMNNNNNNNMNNNTRFNNGNFNNIDIKDNTNYHDLNRIDRRHALFLSVMGPYVKSKCDLIYNKLLENNITTTTTTTAQQQQQQKQQEEEEEEEEENENKHKKDIKDYHERIMKKLKRLFLFCYPYLHVTYEGTFFCYQFAYLMGYTKYFSPFLHIMKQVVKRLDPMDVMSMNNGINKSLQDMNNNISNNNNNNNNNNISHKLKTILLTVRDYGVKYGKYGIIVFIVSLKVTEWWQLSDKTQYNKRKVMQIPPVPEKPMPHEHGIVLPLEKQLCPICCNPRVNPCMTPSGILFCYRCIVLYVRENGCCPYSMIKCKEEQLRRVYDS